MFDDLRNNEDSSGSFTPTQEEADAEIESMLKKKPPRKKFALGGGGKFLGLTAFQRFVLSFLLFCMACVLGIMFLLFTGSISFPI